MSWAGRAIAPDQREKREPLCRYISRPPAATEGLALTAPGHVRYMLNTLCRDATAHIVLEPPGLRRTHGGTDIAAANPPDEASTACSTRPDSQLRAAVTPAQRGMGAKRPPADSAWPPTPRHVALSWARRLNRVFGLEIERCARCSGKLAIIASIGEPKVIAKILSHLERTAPEPHRSELPLGARAPPVRSTLL